MKQLIKKSMKNSFDLDIDIAKDIDIYESRSEIAILNLKQINAPKDNKTKTLWLFCLILEKKSFGSYLFA